MKIGIAGAGGLGSNVAVNLVRTGINSLKVVDFDEIDESNLNRQFYFRDQIGHKKVKALYENLKRINPSLGLTIDEETAVISMVTRLDAQKGLDLLDHIICELLDYDKLQIVILGSGMERYEKRLLALEKRYPEKLAVEIGYNAKLANQIYAGSDMFLMPSQFEPCGLSQLIALKYGSVPIVRETGGLNDTIEAYNEFTSQGNGFSFSNYNAHDMMFTIRRALNMYYNFPKNWNEIMTKGMSQSFSWEDSAEEYLALYQKL